MFSTLPKTNFNFAVTFILSSASAFNLDQTEILWYDRVNPLPDMPILGPSNSAASETMMSKIWTTGDTIM